MTDTNAISLTAVSKVFRLGGGFKKKQAVSDLTFAIAPGTITGLLGPNGSGKSTTLKMILGFLKPSSGEILLLGKDVNIPSTRQNAGYVPESPRFLKFLTAVQTLQYLGRLHGLRGNELDERIHKLLGTVLLTKAAHEPVRGFSKGMTQRLALAQALLSSPSLLIMDEPMSGLDPEGRTELKNLLREIHSKSPQTTLLFSSHVLSDVKDLCTNVLSMANGNLLSHLTTTEYFSREGAVNA